MEVLKVSANSAPHMVAGAIASVMRSDGKVEIQTVGAGATNQAVKAIAVARGYLTSEGIDLVYMPVFGQVMINDDERTAIRFICEKR